MKKKSLGLIVDLSHHNGSVNFCNLVNCGVKGVILKCGGSETKDGHTYQDKLFEDYYIKAKKHGLMVGAYYFGVGSTQQKGVTDAIACRELLKDKQFELPIYLDYECSFGTGSSNNKNNKNNNTSYVLQFVHTLERYGFFVGVYGSDVSTFKEMLNKDALKDISLWVARYDKNGVQYCTGDNVHMWQYTSTANITLSGHCDVSEMWHDFSIIKERGFNGF